MHSQVTEKQCISNKFPGGVDITGPGLLFKNHCQSSLTLRISITLFAVDMLIYKAHPQTQELLTTTKKSLGSEIEFTPDPSG